MTSDRPRAAFNRETALLRINGDEGLLHDLAAFYVEDAPQLLDSLKEAVHQGQAEAAMHAAHTLKSLSATLDAHQAVAVSEIVERSARSGDMTTASDLLPELEAAISAVLRSLHATYSDLA